MRFSIKCKVGNYLLDGCCSFVELICKIYGFALLKAKTFAAIISGKEDFIERYVCIKCFYVLSIETIHHL